MQQDSDYWQRFGGIARLYGHKALQQLQQTHIAVVGIGGVGSWAAEALARTGVGQLTLIDMDDVCVTNSNRQIHAMSSTVGLAKGEVMAQRLRDINPELQVRVIDDFLTQETLADYITSDLDGVIDAIDSAGNKAKLIAYSRRLKLPIITTGAAGGQWDPTQIQVSDLSRTVADPLASKVRRILRRHYHFPKDPKKRFSVPCVYSVEQLKYPQPDGSVCDQKAAMVDGVRLDCSGGFGSVTMVTASFGFCAASRLIERLLNQVSSP